METTVKTTCADCWASQRIGFGRCRRHSTSEQRADLDKHIAELAVQPNPLLAFLRKKAP